MLGPDRQRTVAHGWNSVEAHCPSIELEICSATPSSQERDLGW